MESIAIERSIWINAPRERVWQAITVPETIQRWWGGDYWAFAALEVGAEVQFGDRNNPMLAHIGAVNPPREFAIEWPPQAQYHNIVMVTRYLLEEENGGTRVTVSESGYEALPDDIRQKRFDRSAKGYETVLAGLKTLVEAHP